MKCLQNCFNICVSSFGYGKGWNEWLFRRKANEQVAPDRVKLVVKNATHHTTASLTGLSHKLLTKIDDSVGLGFLPFGSSKLPLKCTTFSSNLFSGFSSGD